MESRKNGTDEPICRTAAETQMQRMDTWAWGKGKRGWDQVAISIDTRTPLPCVTRVSLVAQMVKNLPAMWETWVQSLGWEDPLAKGKATHFSILACRQRVRYD